MLNSFFHGYYLLNVNESTKKLRDVANGAFEEDFFCVATPQKNDNNSSFNKRCIRERKKGPVSGHSLSSLKGYDRVNKW